MRKRKPKTGRNKPKGVVASNLWRVDAAMLDSEAFAVLNGCEMRMLLGFLRRRRWDRKNKRYVNLLDIVYTLDAMKYEANASLQTALDARNSLIEVGFIEVVHHAEGLWGECNVYKISDRFLKWHPDPKVCSQNGFVEVKLRPGKGNKRGGVLFKSNNENGREKIPNQKKPALEFLKASSGKQEVCKKTSDFPALENRS